MRLIIAVTIVFACVFAAVLGLSNSIADDNTTIVDSEVIHLISYRLKDFPVWSQDGKVCNPSLLISHIQSTVSPAAWKGQSTIATNAMTATLEIRTTIENHDLIGELLNPLRNSSVKPVTN